MISTFLRVYRNPESENLNPSVPKSLLLPKTFVFCWASGPGYCDQGSQGVHPRSIKGPEIAQIGCKIDAISDQGLEHFKPVSKKKCRNVNIHSDAVPELTHGTVVGSGLCAFRYIYLLYICI